MNGCWEARMVGWLRRRGDTKSDKTYWFCRFCTAYQSRTGDLLRERQLSWTTRRMRRLLCGDFAFEIGCKGTTFFWIDKFFNQKKYATLFNILGTWKLQLKDFEFLFVLLGSNQETNIPFLEKWHSLFWFEDYYLFLQLINNILWVNATLFHLCGSLVSSFLKYFYT